MKVLVVSAVLPYPLQSGGQVRMYNLLKRLSHDHDVTLFSFIRKESEKEYLTNLSFLRSIKLYMRGHVWQPKYVLKSLTSDLPLLMASYDHPQMKKDLEQELKRNSYDCIHIEPFYVYPSLPTDIQIPVIVAEHNIEYEVYQSYARQFPIPFGDVLLNVDIRKIKQKEELIWKKAYRIVSVSKKDADIISQTVNKEKVTVIPNGVDTSFFPFEKKKFDREHVRFLFVGNFLWMPNTKAVKKLVDLWPDVKLKYPGATLQIVGKHLPKNLQKNVHLLGIEYKEFIEDIRDAYRNADILLAPMTISGGTKFKMLEAMASGCLIMTTKEGMEGIDAKKDVHYMGFETRADVLGNVETVLGNVKKAHTMTAKARALIVLEYDWNVIADLQSQMWKDMV